MKKGNLVLGAALVLLVASPFGVSAAPATEGRAKAKQSGYTCDANNRCESRDGKFLKVDVRKRRNRSDDYDYNRGYRFEIGGLERPTLRYGNNGFIGQSGYFGNGGFRSRQGESAFDNLR